VSAPARILIVDDNRLVRRLVELALEEAGFTPVPAESGEEAFRLAQRDPPDAAVIDQEMPGMKGADLVRALRLSADPRVSAVPAVGVSAYPAAEAELRAAGACDFVRKPIDEEALLDAVNLALTDARHRAWEGASPTAA